MATVTKFPTSNAVDITGWTSPANGYADDSVYATAAPAKSASIASRYGGFDFSSIPAGSVINSVTAEAQYKLSVNTSLPTFGLQVYVSGTGRGTEYTDTTQTLVDRTVTTAPAGLTLSDVQQGTFQVRVRAGRGNTNTAVTFSLDYVKVTVDYTPPSYKDKAGGGALTLVGSGSEVKYVAQALAPDTAPTITNLTGTVTDIDESPDSPDAAWLTASGVPVLRVTFPTPGGPPQGAQKFRVRARPGA